jgi:hypothetical protein
MAESQKNIDIFHKADRTRDPNMPYVRQVGKSLWVYYCIKLGTWPVIGVPYGYDP